MTISGMPSRGTPPAVNDELAWVMSTFSSSVICARSESTSDAASGAAPVVVEEHPRELRHLVRLDVESAGILSSELLKRINPMRAQCVGGFGTNAPNPL